MLSRSGMGKSSPGPWHTYTAPGVRRLRTVRPATKAAARSMMTGRGSAARGFVSIAVTKIEWGTVSTAGMRAKGRWRSAVHRPDFSSPSCTESRARFASCAAGQAGNDSASSPSRASTTACRARRGPRSMATTDPAPGAVQRMRGSPRSLKRAWPSRTLSPTWTDNFGRKPG